MNEQSITQTNETAYCKSDLIYTRRGSPASGCHPQTIGAELETSTGSIVPDPVEGVRLVRPRMPRAIEAEEDTADSPEADNPSDQPEVPPLITFAGDRADYRYVIARSGHCRRSVALKYFRGRYSSSDWMQDQDGWLKNASLLASVGQFSFNPIRFLYCSKGGKLCFLPRVCHRCNLDQRVEPLQKMFEGTYAKRPFWCSIVLDNEMDADKAGIWTGPHDDRRALYLPHEGKPDGRFLRFSPIQLDMAARFYGFQFHIVRYLQKAGIIDGWIAVAEPSLSFWPDPNSTFYCWNDIDHAFLPHIHVLVCGYHPFDEKVIRAIYDVLQQFLGNQSYANFWFNPVTSQSGITQWINYCIKPVPLAEWYANAVHRGCSQSDLNLVFDDLALESCSGLMSQIYSPRRGGVLAANSGNAYILNRLPPMLTRKQMAQCKDEKFYLEHEDSFWRTIEKREFRRGGNFRCRTKTRKAALRRISA